MEFNPDILAKFRKSGEIKPASEIKKSALPGRVITRNGGRFLISEYSTDNISLDLPFRSQFASAYESCLELIYGVREKKAGKFSECGIKNLHDASRHEHFGEEAGRILSALDGGFDGVKTVLEGRFSSSHRMFFLLLSYFNKEDLLFVDIETRSLNFETALIEIGAGFYKGNIFTVVQLTALDEAGEFEVLEEFKTLLEGKKAFVTFNGRSFDIPFIDSRYAYYAGPLPELGNMYNFDLLHFSRCAFKNMYESYRLKEIEARVLKKHREHDIDGSEVDYYYSRWLQTGNANFINPIIFHNKVDIVSLAELTAKLIDVWK